MKKIFWGVLFFVIALPCGSMAQPKGLGLRFVLGEPTGISGKYWLSRTTAIDGATAWSFDDEFWHIHIDHLRHYYDVIPVSKGELPLYFGIGGKIRAGDDSQFGARFPFGLEYLFEKAPLDIFLEIAPILNLVDEVDFELDGGIGVRYFFGK